MECALLPDGVTEVIEDPLVCLGVANTSSTASVPPKGGAKGAEGSGGSGGGGGGGMVIVGSRVWGAWGVPVMSYSGNTLSWTQPAVLTSHHAWLLIVPCVGAFAAKFAEHCGWSFCKHSHA